MRQAQNSKRVRGRGGRKMVNQLNRTMDSNGPDVKIRGTASHIYDKYQALARDANASGDRIAAENYLQHAEHYFRLINAMQAQANGAGVQPQPGSRGVNGARGEGPGETPQPNDDSPQPIVAMPAEQEEAGESAGEAAEGSQDAAQAPRGRGPRGPRGRRRPANGEGKAASSRKSNEGEPQLALSEQEAGVSESRA